MNEGHVRKGGATMVARLRPMKRIARTSPAIAEPSRAEKLSGVQSLIAVIMERASAASSAWPPLDRTKTIFGSPNGAASRREAEANRDLIVIVRRTPAGGEPCRDAMDAGDRRRRADGLRLRPEGQRDDPDRGKAPNRLTSLHSVAGRPQSPSGKSMKDCRACAA